MSSVWYIGRSNQRILTPTDWAALGVTGIHQTVAWNEDNGFSVNYSELSSRQIDVLSSLEGFLLGKPDGPREGGPFPPPNTFGGESVYFREMREMYRSMENMMEELSPILSEGASPSGEIVFTGTALEGRKALRAADSAATGAMRNLMFKLNENVSNANMLFNSDSTGGTVDGWIFQIAQRLSVQFPHYTVNYYLWDEAGNKWPVSPTWTQAGTGAYVLNVWNAAVGGSNTGYFQGSLFPNLIKNADLIIINHGFNQGGPLNDETQRQYRRNVYMAFVDELAFANPNAGVVLIGQPPDGRVGREGWQAQKNIEWAKIASWRGWGFINIHHSWIEYGNWLADLTLPDQIHPNLAGQTKWAGLVQNALENSSQIVEVSQPPLSNIASQVFKNQQLSNWSGSLPEGVTSNVNCTVSKELADFETGVQAMKITSTSTSGFSYVELSGTAAQWGIKGRLANQTYTVAVRLKVPAANTGTVRVALLDNNGPSGTMATDVSAYPSARDRFIWVYATKTFPSNATTLTLWIIARTSGASIVDLIVDEIRI